MLSYWPRGCKNLDQSRHWLRKAYESGDEGAVAFMKKNRETEDKTKNSTDSKIDSGELKESNFASMKKEELEPSVINFFYNHPHGEYDDHRNCFFGLGIFQSKNALIKHEDESKNHTGYFIPTISVNLKAEDGKIKKLAEKALIEKTLVKIIYDAETIVPKVLYVHHAVFENILKTPDITEIYIQTPLVGSVCARVLIPLLNIQPFDDEGYRATENFARLILERKKTSENFLSSSGIFNKSGTKRSGTDSNNKLNCTIL